MLTITVGFILVNLITKSEAALAVALAIGLTGLLSEALSKKVDFLWWKLTWLLSLVIPNILLTVIYFLILFPVAALSKLSGKEDALNGKNRPGSLFRTRRTKLEKSSFEKPW